MTGPRRDHGSRVKPAPFEYRAPVTAAETVGLLADGRRIEIEETDISATPP